MFSENTLPLDTLDLDLTTSLKVTKRNSPKNFMNKDQLQSHSKSSLVLRTTTQVSIALKTVERPLMMLITPFWPLDTETKVERTSGTSRTHGEPHGETEDTSKWKEVSTCAPLPNATHILSLTAHVKLDLHSFVCHFSIFVSITFCLFFYCINIFIFRKKQI